MKIASRRNLRNILHKSASAQCDQSPVHGFEKVQLVGPICAHAYLSSWPISHLISSKSTTADPNFFLGANASRGKSDFSAAFPFSSSSSSSLTPSTKNEWIHFCLIHHCSFSSSLSPPHPHSSISLSLPFLAATSGGKRTEPPPLPRVSHLFCFVDYRFLDSARPPLFRLSFASR